MIYLRCSERILIRILPISQVIKILLLPDISRFSLQPISNFYQVPNFNLFLLFRNNHHWDSLHRVGKFMTADMNLLREALTILIDESEPIRERLNRLRPERYWGEHSMVSHLGMPVLTAILQVTQPDHYGVWNNTSDAGMKKIKLWKRKWDGQPAGDSFEEMNGIYLFLAKTLDIDLWTLDSLWWVMKKVNTPS